MVLCSSWFAQKELGSSGSNRKLCTGNTSMLTAPTGRVILPGFILEGVCLLTHPWERSLAPEKSFLYSLFIIHPSWPGSLSVGGLKQLNLPSGDVPRLLEFEQELFGEGRTPVPISPSHRSRWLSSESLCLSLGCAVTPARQKPGSPLVPCLVSRLARRETEMQPELQDHQNHTQMRGAQQGSAGGVRDPVIPPVLQVQTDWS